MRVLRLHEIQVVNPGLARELVATKCAPTKDWSWRAINYNNIFKCSAE
jgi:hypothetical protein